MAAVHCRLQRYPSVDLLLTSYFQGSEFAAEAIRSLFPQTVHAWDLRFIEDAAWGKRLLELEDQPVHQGAFTAAEDDLAQGRTYMAQGDWKRARDAFGKAVKAIPENAESWRELGRACAALADWRRAQNAFEQAQRFQPTQDDEALLEEIRTIRRILHKLRHRPSDAALHMRLGVLLMAWEHGDDALVHLTRAVELAPEWPLAYLYLGMEYHVRQQWDSAEEVYQLALAGNPSNTDLRRLLDECRAHRTPESLLSEQTETCRRARWDLDPLRLLAPTAPSVHGESPRSQEGG